MGGLEETTSVELPDAEVPSWGAVNQRQPAAPDQGGGNSQRSWIATGILLEIEQVGDYYYSPGPAGMYGEGRVSE